MRYFLVLFLIVNFSCEKGEKAIDKTFSKVDIKVVSNDTTLNIRALEVNKKGKGVFATSDGRIGVVLNDLDEKTKKSRLSTKVLFSLKTDSIVPNFRAVAVVNETIFALTIGKPALLYKITSKDSVQLVYKEDHETVFYDAMRFWNEKEGIAIGDPTNGCISIIITRDGGTTWNKVPCSKLPKAKEGEAAFAASNTNIAMVGEYTWVATGGISSRVLFSIDKGKTWTINNDVPIIQGAPASGIFSIAFYDKKNGFAIGGNYTKPEANVANKMRTADGGKSWQLVASKQEPGYRSCVQYVPNSNGEHIVAIGFKGIDYSSNAGDTWSHFSDDSFYTLRFVNDSIAFAAGKGKIAKLVFK